MFLGVGISSSMTIVITLVGDYFEGEERQKFIGYQAAFIGMAGIVFLSLGGFLATLHWRVPFLIYSFSLLLIPIIFFFLEESKPPTILSKVVVASPLLLKVLFPIGTLFMVLFYLMPTQLPFLL
ncbi:MAG: MFS family permease [Neolewinella sp.]|jgi:MFS family permease